MRSGEQYPHAFDAAPAPGRAVGSGATDVAVHILEDDPGVSDALRLLLTQYGHKVIAHPDAESFFEARPPRHEDVVIVDLGLPGISGAQVIRWLGALERPPRIICITGQAQHAIDEQLGDVAPPILLRKPLTEDKLTELF